MMAEPEAAARDILRTDVLAGGHDDYTSMADVQQYISSGRLADSVAERQQLVVDTIRSLLADRLVEMGIPPTPSNPGFKTWPGSVDEVMTRFIDRFVTHHDDRHGWEYTIWLNLTAEGRRISDEIVLRERILERGPKAFVSMADVKRIMRERHLADSDAERQQLVVDTIRSLLVDGLVTVGEISGRNDPGFTSWPGTVDEVMTRFIDRFVEHYDERTQWDTIRLNLAAKGEQAANGLVGEPSKS